MSGHRILTIAVDEIHAEQKAGSRTEYLAEFARAHPDRDTYGQCVEWSIWEGHDWRGGAWPTRAEAEQWLKPGQRLVSAPATTATGASVLVTPMSDCTLPEGEPHYCAKHCTGPACRTQMFHACCGMCSRPVAKS